MRLFLDDMRACPEGFVLCRDADECMLLLKECDVECLSLDHDLGTEKTGYDVAKFLVEENIWPKTIFLHSANPVGIANMEQLLNRYRPDDVRVIRGKPVWSLSLTGE